MKLYEINKVIEDVLENGFYFDEFTGEILFDSCNLEELQVAFNDKVDNIACYIKSIEGMNAAIDNEIKALNARKKTNDKKVEWLKNYVTAALKSRDMDKYESARNKLSFRRSQAVNITNERLIPAFYFKESIEFKLDKAAIKKDLKEGKVIEGCELVTNNNLQVK